VPLYERGGSSVEEGFDGLHVVAYCAAVLLVVMKWMAAITGDQSGYFGSFSRRERILGDCFPQGRNVLIQHFFLFLLAVPWLFIENIWLTSTV
jgi:hypothetical protein